MTLSTKSDIAKWCETCSWGRIEGVAPCTACTPVKSHEPTNWRPKSPVQAPLCNTGRPKPETLPEGHPDAPDAPDNRLQALGEMIDDNITRIEAFVDRSDLSVISDYRRFIEAMQGELENMQRIIGDKAVTRKVEPDTFGQRLRGACKELAAVNRAMIDRHNRRYAKKDDALFDAVEALFASHVAKWGLGGRHSRDDLDPLWQAYNRKKEAIDG